MLLQIQKKMSGHGLKILSIDECPGCDFHKRFCRCPKDEIKR